MPRAEFITVDNPLWERALRMCEHDVYHMPAYVQLEAEWNNSKPIAFYYEDQGAVMLLPLLERQTPGGLGTDVVSPYGYSPPVFSISETNDFKSVAMHQYFTDAAGRGIVTTFIRLHPIICSSLHRPAGIMEEYWFDILRGQTVTMPLTQSTENWMNTIASGHRLDLKKSAQNGFHFLMNTDYAWQTFPEVYRQTMERINARAVYHYSDNYIRRMRETLFDEVICAGVTDCNGKILCVSLFTVVGNIMQYHLSGTRAEALRLAPNKFLLAQMREWALTNGITHFHLGGGFGGSDDTLFKFKSRFGGEILPFRTVSIIHDHQKYQAECNHWQSQSKIELVDSNGFFPAYRAPIIQKKLESM